VGGHRGAGRGFRANGTARAARTQAREEAVRRRRIMDDLKTGDRVTVRLTGEPPFNGVIIGETSDGHAWHIVKDGTKFSRGIHKSFCRPEESD